MRRPGLAEFPDCVAARSAKHLRELADMVAAGARAALVYVIQMEADRFDVARDIDPAYDAAFAARARRRRRILRLRVSRSTPDEITHCRREVEIVTLLDVVDGCRPSRRVSPGLTLRAPRPSPARASGSLQTKFIRVWPRSR